MIIVKESRKINYTIKLRNGFKNYLLIIKIKNSLKI